MRFTIKQAGCSSERIGCLAGFLKNPNYLIETPTSALLTQGASVVHLTADVLAKVFSNPQLLWVPLSNTFFLEQGVKAQGQGVAKFAGVSSHMLCATLQNVSEVTPSGHFEMDKVPLWTKHGKQLITADRYVDIMEVFKPDIILAIADGHIPLDESSKRIAKSVVRTCSLLDKCVTRFADSKQLKESCLVGVIVAAGQEKKCNESIKHILKHKDSLGGVALAGLTDGSEESLTASTDNIEAIFKRIGEALPNDLLHIVEGPWNPAVIMAAIEHGWDVFDGSYPLKLTNAGQALALNFDVTSDGEELCVLNLVDIGYKEDFRPILAGCECLACKKHTRAYIRHLLNTREMLSNVLLSIHNLHHFDQMFQHARRHINAGTFKTYRHHITKQYERYQAVLEKTKVEKKQEKSVEESKPNKKICVSNGTIQNSM